MASIDMAMGATMAVKATAELKRAIRDRDPEVAQAQVWADKILAAVAASGSIPGVGRHDVISGVVLLAILGDRAERERADEASAASAWRGATSAAARRLRAAADELEKMQRPR